ncbi:MAG: alpha/beta hydrolase [Bacteroidia bacterium]|nr:alpha/beta hydrolase [Bacteroidia bacterium]
MKIFLSIILITLLSSCYGQQKERFRPSFTVSESTTHKIPDGQDFTFGYLEVLENRSNPSSKTIKVPVYIFKSRSKNPKPDPILYTVGGPGYTSMRAAPYMRSYQYLDDRDFILFEQRGTQYAQPNLACPEWSDAVYLSNLSEMRDDQLDSLFSSAVRDCRTRLADQGIDLNAYNTNEIAADIEDLRKVLGIGQYNLLTLSYSTKIAQVLIRDYPEAIRSVVMDSPLPLEVNYDERSLSNLMETVNKLFKHCSTDKNCNDAFPNLKNRFFEYLKDKNNNPLTVVVENPNTKEEQTFYLRGKDIITVFSSAYTGNVPEIPFEVSKLLNNDLSSVKQRLSNLFTASGNGNGQGMRLSVWCAEEFPFVSQEKVKEEINRYPEIEGISPMVFQPEICSIWSVEKVGAIENMPVKSDIPVLFISGEYDNETPPSWATEMQKRFSESFHLIFKGWMHGPTTNWSNPCAMRAANDFFNDPEVRPNPKCLKNIRTPKFRTE